MDKRSRIYVAGHKGLVGKLHGLGWKHRIELREGVRSTYGWFLANQEAFRR